MKALAHLTRAMCGGLIAGAVLEAHGWEWFVVVLALCLSQYAIDGLSGR